ncbi:hypothetical protein AK812_SmicGene23346 [Symbiodinium microadriaticum]|uniref:Uncharacterized protein n=1 Tax=Symbiodinium microadriaticum TaxID=2951 RepID=A0A1Q9DHQ0_SYMMI|nr:hypothetical protein AK812_SmicGene23346 [Symbiodinium microadriaticum]CAE7364692.1 unnamed protein product [Symbiodinium microadriaticum]CAE7932175.1 unnamed protein product [Symbiodinium sp. KB8]
MARLAAVAVWSCLLLLPVVKGTELDGCEADGCEADVSSALQLGRGQDEDDPEPAEDPHPEQEPEYDPELDAEECEHVCCYSRFKAPESLCGCLAAQSISCNYCSRPYIATPEEYQVPHAGSFNISIPVEETTLANISKFEVGLGLAGFRVGTLGVTLLGPAAQSLGLKEPEMEPESQTSQVHWIFTDRSCSDCMEPTDSFSQLQGEDAKGTWTLIIETDPEVANGLVTWVELSITSC